MVQLLHPNSNPFCTVHDGLYASGGSVVNVVRALYTWGVHDRFCTYIEAVLPTSVYSRTSDLSRRAGTLVLRGGSGSS